MEWGYAADSGVSKRQIRFVQVQLAEHQVGLAGLLEREVQQPCARLYLESGQYASKDIPSGGRSVAPNENKAEPGTRGS